MRLIDKYLSAVSDHLPRKNRDDIEAELRSSLYEQLEERSTALGRELTEEEQADLLRRFGHPLKVAGEYAPQQYLIGPTLFPYYLYLLKAIAIGLVLFHVALTVVLGVAAGRWELLPGDTVTRILGSLLVMGAVVTIAFALLERSGQRLAWAEAWDPLRLPDRASEHAVHRGESITEIAGALVLLLWWNGVIGLPTHLAWNGAGLAIARSAGWDAVVWPVNVLLIASLILCSTALVAGAWRRTSVALRVVLEVASAMIVIYLLRLPEVVQITTPGGAEFARLQLWLGWTVRAVLGVVLVMTLFDVWKYVRLAVRMGRRPAAGAAAREAS